MEVEYTLAHIQMGQNSFALRTNRKEGCDPRLRIQTGAQEVRWELTNLVEGKPQTVTGDPRKTRLDFYFLWETLRRDRGQMPIPTVSPNGLLRLTPTNSQGTERQGGTSVRMITPLRRYKIQHAELFVGQAPTIHAVGNEPSLHMDKEDTPPTIYKQAIEELHFGIQAAFQVEHIPMGTYSYVVVSMTAETYATIYEDIQAL